MSEDQRIQNEIIHGEYIREHGEEVWNWSSPAGKLRWARRCRLFKDFIGNRKSLVLEIGCGTGLFTRELADTNNRIVAIDISGALIEKAKERVCAKNVEFVVDNAYQTKFKPDSYDFAPQVGIPSRLIVADIEGDIIKLANPLIKERWGTEVMEEGCLSLPGIRVSVKRSLKITVMGYNENGKPVELKANGLPARVIQHEIDHIDGRLIIDYLPLWERVKHFIKTEIKVFKGKQRQHNE